MRKPALVVAAAVTLANPSPAHARYYHYHHYAYGPGIVGGLIAGAALVTPRAPRRAHDPCPTE